MRKQDIAVTIPGKPPTIYAIGTRPETNEKVWEDPSSPYFGSRGNYSPGYVLEIRDSGFVLALFPAHHPDTPYAKHNKQASVEGALDYTLEDYEIRKAVLTKYSRPLTQEESDAKHDEISRLKEGPRLWRVEMIRATHVRMLWSDYTIRLDAAVADRQDQRDREQRRKDAAKANATALVEALVGLKIGMPENDLPWVISGAASGSIKLPTEVAQALVDGYDRLIGEH